MKKVLTTAAAAMIASINGASFAARQHQRATPRTSVTAEDLDRLAAAAERRRQRELKRIAAKK